MTNQEKLAELIGEEGYRKCGVCKREERIKCDICHTPKSPPPS